MSTTNTQHTPGPWRVNGNSIDGSERVHTNGRKRNSLGYSSASYSEQVCEIYGSIDLPCVQANARLIAAAPEMLANHKTELIWLRHIATRVTSPPSVLLGIEQAIKTHEAIIAKAEGAAYRNKSNVPYWSSQRD